MISQAIRPLLYERGRHLALSAASLFRLFPLTAAANLQAQNTPEIAGIEVRGAAVDEGTFHQTAPVGPYNQPQWTTQRAFSTTRVYVRPPGSLELFDIGRRSGRMA
jgi:hypothetical protein